MALSAGRVLRVVLVAVEFVDPQRMIRRDLRLVELFKNMFDIADQRDRGTGVLADLRGVDVNMHQNFILCDQIGLAERPVRYSRADHDDHVRVVHGPVAIGLAVIAHHTVKEEMVGGKDSQSHHGAHHGNILFLHKSAHFFLGAAAQVHAAADADDRPFGLLELFDHSFDLDCMSRHRRLVGADADSLGIREFADLRFLHIDRNIDEDWPLSAGAGNVEGLFHDPGDIRSFAHDIAEFYEGLAGPGYVDLLEDVASHKAAVHLTGDADQRNAVRESCGDPRDQIGRAGTARDNGDADLARDPGIPAGLVGRVLLLSHQDGLDIGIQNAVIERTDGDSGISEDVFHPFSLKTFHNCIRCYHLCSS